MRSEATQEQKDRASRAVPGEHAFGMEVDEETPRGAPGRAAGMVGIGACQGEASADLSPIVVTATRVAESSFDVPASIDRVTGPRSDGQLQENISESLMTVPGVSAESRQNYAQDLQLSVRGFGARSSFGVRGVRLYSDGIPGTMPDGQGQFSQFDLGSAGHIEVLRGPFSALYGNSSGGVISIFTEDAPPGYFVDGTAQYGTFNTQRYALKTTGDDGTGQLRGRRRALSDRRLSLSQQRRARQFQCEAASHVQRCAQADPRRPTSSRRRSCRIRSGLTQAQLAANPRQAGTGAIQYNTRKSLDQEQIGAIYDDKLGSEDALSSTRLRGSSRHHAVSSHTARRRRRRSRFIPAASSTWTAPSGASTRT